MVDCSSWLPSEITTSEEFLSSDFDKLRNYVRKTRNEDISIPLFVYENRVIYSRNGEKAFRELKTVIRQRKPFYEIDFYGENNDPIGWETIRSYPYQCSTRGESCYRIEKREIKKCFLMGWLEVRLWDRGFHKEQKVYHAPETPEDIGISADKTGQFVLGESALFSMELMRNYWNLHLKLRPQQRDRKPRFVNRKLSLTTNNRWHVFVTSDLRNYYYSDDEAIRHSRMEEFSPLRKKMMTINCQKNTETGHAAIANYDSWQAYLHAWNIEKGTQMDEGNTMLGQIRKLQTESRNDQTILSDEIRNILGKIASETGSSGLTYTEKNIIRQASESSPKTRLLYRMAQIEFVRSVIGKYLFEKADKIKNIENTLYDRLIRWISPLWEPLWAGQLIEAASLPEEKRVFFMEQGEISISCSWEREDENDPAYIRMSWEADIPPDSELWARFINPETQEIRYQISLGAITEGEIAIESDILGFDPSKERWAISIIVADGES